MVWGTLTSILGPDYIMNPHRHPHLNKPGSAGQDWRVRGNATLSLAKSSRPNNDAIPNLIQVLADENRYNRFYASLALSRLGTTEAREALINDLFTSRWCPITTNQTPY